MAGQQQQIIDTIFNMKRKLLRKDDSDSEGHESSFSSHKQDLRRKVRYARGSDADFLTNLHPYKKRIEHAGYHRQILQRNPPRYDADGDIVEPEDEYDEEDELEAIEDYPYGNIRLENLLAPLTSAANLPNHPSMSNAYTSKHLTGLANEAGGRSRKEQITLAKAKTLLVKLEGDSLFVPDALAAMNGDAFERSILNGAGSRPVNGRAFLGHDLETQDQVESQQDMDMGNTEEVNGISEELMTNGDAISTTFNELAGLTNGASHNADAEKQQENSDRLQSMAADDASDTASQQTLHRMTTRARAQAASTPSPPTSPVNNGISHIHPMFAFSADSIPDRDFGVPAAEAEETRLLLMAYIQKQEEVVRITSDLYHGLLEADRMRQDVFKSCKADGHIGEMSDGEDWYDGEEWGLDQDLTKGRDEEEDDTAVAGKKSTRQRRKPDKEDR